MIPDELHLTLVNGYAFYRGLLMEHLTWSLRSQALCGAILQKVSEVAVEVEADLNPPMILTGFKKGLADAFNDTYTKFVEKKNTEPGSGSFVCEE